MTHFFALLKAVFEHDDARIYALVSGGFRRAADQDLEDAGWPHRIGDHRSLQLMIQQSAADLELTARHRWPQHDRLKAARARGRAWCRNGGSDMVDLDPDMRLASRPERLAWLRGWHAQNFDLLDAPFV